MHKLGTLAENHWKYRLKSYSILKERFFYIVMKSIRISYPSSN